MMKLVAPVTAVVVDSSPEESNTEGSSLDSDVFQKVNSRLKDTKTTGY